jgi:YesN/AraC family two-component response regulator
LSLMEKNPVDFVITDINMPGMNGILLTQKIKENFDSDIIIMTGFVKDFSYENVIEKGPVILYKNPSLLMNWS